MDPRICTAASAILNLVDFGRSKFKEWDLPALLENLEEEIFYDPRNDDVYASFTASFQQNRRLQTQQFSARVTTSGEVSQVCPKDLALLDLEDISHLILHILDHIKQHTVATNDERMAAAKAIAKSALKTSKTIMSMSC